MLITQALFSEGRVDAMAESSMPGDQHSGQTAAMQKVEPAVAELSEKLQKLDRDNKQLEEVLNAMFQVFADRGLKPTPHLSQVQDALKRHLKEAEAASVHIQERMNIFKQLVRTTALITSSLDIEKVLDDVMDTVVQLTGAERAYLMLYDDNKELKVRAARNWEMKTLDEGQVGVSRGVINAAVESGEAIITTNAQEDARFETAESIVVQKLRSIICIPLAMRGNTVGVLYADNRLQRGVFQEGIVPILTAFGTQAAIAINNAQQFGRVKEDLQDAERMIQELKIEIDMQRVDKACSAASGTLPWRTWH
jgi:adenylate cyclase